jgi:hypothetical protein
MDLLTLKHWFLPAVRPQVPPVWVRADPVGPNRLTGLDVPDYAAIHVKDIVEPAGTRPVMVNLLVVRSGRLAGLFRSVCNLPRVLAI